ncbi:class I SAM-dependent methyltransferase [Corticibacterium sp. UT-5YL-CI-8]|nr:class I SAM-dependent methyltransferase [Tianweitania sp. UT-5YL-CI-8]
MATRSSPNTPRGHQDKPVVSREYDMVLANVMSRIAFMRPRYMARSAWQEHVPFAFWMVEALQPDVIVELGVHTGVSYFSMCQAVERLEIDARCFAVDTWKGDDHAGFYGEEIFDQVRTHNDKYYSGFSRLVKGTFDDALRHFSDGTIDLLHIDGLHTFEAVEHDFEAWLPKLSKRAVVMMHDTNVREKEFGVFRLFEQLRTKYPSFEFVHGHGLGVLGVGTNQSARLKELFTVGANDIDRRMVRDIFVRLGRSCADAFEAEQADKRLDELKKEIAQRDETLKDLEEEIASERKNKAAAQDEVAELQVLIGDRAHQINELNFALQEKDTSLQLLNDEHQANLQKKTAAQDRFAALEAELEVVRTAGSVELEEVKLALDQRDARLAKLAEEHHEAHRQNAVLQEQLNKVEAELRKAAAAETQYKAERLERLNEGRLREAELQSARDEVLERDERLSRLNEEYKGISRLKTELREKLKEVEAELATSRSDLVAQAAELAQSKSSLNEKNTDLSKLNDEYQEVRRRKTAIQDKLTKVEGELLASQRNFATQSAELTERLRELEERSAELEQAKLALEERDASLSKLNDEHQEVRRLRKVIQDKLTKVEGELQKSRSDNSAQSIELSKLSSELEKRSAELEQAKSALEERDASLSKLNDEHQEVRRLRKVIQDKLTKVEGELQQSLSDNAAQAAELLKRSAELEKCTGELVQTKSLIEGRDAHLAKLSDELIGVHRQKQAIQDKLTKVQAELEAVSAENQEKIDQQRDEIGKLRKTYADTEWRRGELDALLLQEREYIESIRQELVRTRQERSNADLQRGELEILLQHEQVTVDRLSDELKAADEERQAIELKLANREQAFSRMRDEAHELRQKIARLEAENQRLDVGAKELVSLRNKLSHTESALAQRQLETEQTAAELSEARNEIKRMTALQDESRKVADGLKEHVEVLFADLRSKQERSAADEAAHKDIVVKFQAQLDEINALKSEIEETRSITSELREAKEKATTENGRLEGKLKERFEEIATLTRMISDNQSESRRNAARLEAQARQSAAKLKHLQIVAAKEMGNAVSSLLDGGQWRFMPGKMRLKRQLELVRKSGLFDADWYLGHYEDVAQAGIDPLLHYVVFGAKEGREPNSILAQARGEQ